MPQRAGRSRASRVEAEIECLERCCLRAERSQLDLTRGEAMGNTACCEDTGSTKGPRRRRDVMDSSDSDSDSGSDSSGSESSDSEDDASPRPAAGGRRIWLAGKSPGGPLGNALQVKIPKTVRDSPSVTSARGDTRRRREEALRLSPRDETSDEESSDDGGSSRRSSDSDSDSDLEGGRGGSRSPRPSSTRGSPRQRKTARKYEGQSKSELKTLCRENSLAVHGNHGALVSRLVNADLGDESDDDVWDREERKIAKKFEKRTESQLRRQLRKAGMAESGKKQALIRRLVKGRQEPPGWDSSDDDSDDSDE